MNIMQHEFHDLRCIGGRRISRVLCHTLFLHEITVAHLLQGNVYILAAIVHCIYMYTPSMVAHLPLTADTSVQVLKSGEVVRLTFSQPGPTSDSQVCT